MKVLATLLAVGALLAAAASEPVQKPPVKPQPPAAGSGVSPRQSPTPPEAQRSARRASYTIGARLDSKTHEVHGELKLVWKNASTRPATYLLFHLYQNAFKNQTTLMVGSALRHYPKRAGGKKGWGWTRVSQVRVSGKPVADTRLEHDGTVLRVTPVRAIPGAGQAEITMKFVTQLPQVQVRSGYAGDFHMVAQWFPKIGVRAPDGTWHCHPYYLTSEFYADFGVYRVTLEVPRRFDVAATGRRIAEKRLAKGARRLTYLAQDVHDFAWAAGRGMKRVSRKLGSVRVQVVHFGDPHEKVKRHLDVTVRALDLLQRWLGKYPYPVLTAVMVPANARMAGGMEYPTLFTSSVRHAWFLERSDALGTTVHELVHQYFYGLLASNEFAEPWLDEGFTTYVTGVLMDRLFGADRSALELGPFRLGYFAASRIFMRMAPGWDPAQLQANRFAEPRSYFTNVYGRASLALCTLERQIGWKRMRALLGDYVKSHRMTHPRGEDFFRVMDQHVPERPLRRFFRDAIQTAGVLDYEVAKVIALKLREPKGRYDTALDRQRRAAARVLAKKKYENRVLLHRLGELRIPITVELRFSDGSRVRRRWDGQERWHWLVVRRDRPVVTAELDPDRTLTLERRLLDNGLRVKPDARPARRVAGRLLSALQTLLQLVGF